MIYPGGSLRTPVVPEGKAPVSPAPLKLAGMPGALQA